MEDEFEWDAPPNPSNEWSPRPDRCSDADVGDSSPASSNFSSCNGSDFDRYCSANSVLESASICSSIGYYSGIGDEFSSEGYSFRGKFLRTHCNGKECLSDGGAESPKADCSNGNPLARSNSSSRLIHGFTEISFSSCYDICGEGNTEKSLSPLLVNGKRVSSSSFVNCSLGDYGDGDLEKSALSAELWNKQNGIHLDIDIGSVIKLETNEDISPQSKHSDIEASIFDDGIDSEGRIQSRESSFKLAEKTNHEDMNPPFISSSVAFGSNDWDEFVHDTESGGLSSLSLHLDQSFQHQDEHIGRESEEKAQDILASFEAENLRVKGVGSRSYVSAINPKAHVIDIHSQMRGSSCNIINSHGVDAVDQTAKISKYDSASVLQNTLSVANEVKGYLNSMFDHGERKFQSSHNEENVVKGVIGTSETNLNGESELLVDSLASSNVMMKTSHKLNASGGEIMRPEICQHSSILSLSNNGDSSTLQRLQGKNLGYRRLIKANVQESEVKKLDADDSYDEMVLEMEEILLDSGNCQGSMNLQTNQYSSHHPCHFEDASSTVSATDDQPVLVSSKIDRAEVVGAKQKKGDVSFGERLVGVREYTMYQIKVWSGMDEWKVERRYRDFFALYCQLKALFTSHGLSLPSAWFNVERDSRKLFGNASPNVVMERSILIEDCLRSILNSKYPFGNPSPLIMFLTPGKIMLKPGLLRSLVPHYLQKLSEDAYLDDTSLLGKTISLVVEVKPHKSLRQLLEIQHYTCAGCHRHLDAGKTLFRELVQTFGWNRPRFCEYTGQLFCASCHTNDTSVLPARVLHHWDFTLYSVSQFAKAYLESIYEQNMAREKHLKAFCAVFAFQPMLCVSAVNPFLFSKVPALHHVINFRKKIGAMLPYVNCPFRSSIEKSLGFRRHFLESNDFFALRDLVDLSKGPFAVLPMMVENISNLIFEHITQQCLVCYDSGVSCGARQACHDPVSLIFPFQEVEVENCASCGSIFHKACYVDLLGCPCSNNSAFGKSYGPEEPSMIGTSQGPVRVLDTSIHPRVSNPVTGFFTNILTKIKSDKIWKPKGSSPVILMSSLPSSSS